MRRTKRLALVAPVAVAAVVLSACGGSSSGGTPPASGAASGGSAASTAAVAAKPLAKLTIAQEQAPAQFNQLQTDGNSAELQIILESILPFAFRGQPDATFGWDRNLLVDEPTVSTPSPQTIVYHIKPEAKWNDGTPIDAKDFIYNWKSQNGVDPAFQAAANNGYQDIQSVTGSDGGKTVTVVFKKNYSDWRGLFGPLYPAHVVEPLGPKGFNAGYTDGFSFTGKPYSGGPYVQDSYKVNESLTLVPNPAWWGPKPQVGKLVYRFIQDTTQFPTGISNNEIDITNPQPTADEVQKFQSIDRVKTEVYPQLVFEHIDFNFKNPFLADPAVRKAIATALDLKTLIAGTIGQFAPATVPLGNHNFVNSQKGYEDHRGSYGSGDTAAAKKLLEGAGYTLSGATYSKGGKPLELGITAKNGNPLRVSEEEIMQSQLAKAGIKLNIKNTDKSIGKFTAAHEYDIALFAWVANPAIGQNQSIYSTPPAGANTQNTQFYSSKQVDNLFNQAVAELDTTKANALYNQVDKVIYDDMATLPLFQKAGVLVYPKNTVNIRTNATQDGFTYNSEMWGAQ